MNGKRICTVVLVVLGAAAVVAGVAFAQQQMGDKEPASAATTSMPFGGKADVDFAKALWTATEGYQNWPIRSDLHPGKSPHGKFLKIYWNIVSVNGKLYDVLVKDNFGGDNVTADMIQKDPMKYLVVVTTMVQRGDDYDPEDNNWFYVEYKPDGTIVMNDKNVALAGRVNKGMAAGCIPCHVKAEGHDFIFSNDNLPK
jgi:hypothetical protein